MRILKHWFISQMFTRARAGLGLKQESGMQSRFLSWVAGTTHGFITAASQGLHSVGSRRWGSEMGIQTSTLKWDSDILTAAFSTGPSICPPNDGFYVLIFPSPEIELSIAWTSKFFWILSLHCSHLPSVELNINYPFGAKRRLGILGVPPENILALNPPILTSP